MARKRMIEPEFYGDHAELSVAARYLFAGLRNLADDAGRLRYDPRAFKRFVFPDDDLEMAPLLHELLASDRIVRYTSDGELFAYVPERHWNQTISHPTRSRLPEPQPQSTQGKQGFLKSLAHPGFPEVSGGLQKTLEDSSSLPEDSPQLTNQLGERDSLSPTSLSETSAPDESSDLVRGFFDAVGQYQNQGPDPEVVKETRAAIDRYVSLHGRAELVDVVYPFLCKHRKRGFRSAGVLVHVRGEALVARSSPRSTAPGPSPPAESEVKDVCPCGQVIEARGADCPSCGRTRAQRIREIIRANGPWGQHDST